PLAFLVASASEVISMIEYPVRADAPPLLDLPLESRPADWPNGAPPSTTALPRSPNQLIHWSIDFFCSSGVSAMAPPLYTSTNLATAVLLGPLSAPTTNEDSRNRQPGRDSQTRTWAVARRPPSLTTSMALGSCSLISVSWVTTRTWRKRPLRRSRASSMRSLRSGSRGPNTSSSTSSPTAPPDWNRTCSLMATRNERLARSVSEPENRFTP